MPALFGGKPDDGISTTFADTWSAPPSTPLDRLELAPELYLPLLQAPRTPSGGFQLKPGLYAATVRSYCVLAGTHSPTSGDGYRPAPLRGSNAGVIETILRESEKHPEISQSTVQMLLWGILSQTKVENYSPDMLTAAHTLLSPEQFTAISLRTVEYATIRQALTSMPAELARAFDALNQLQTAFKSGRASYEELEHIAVLPPLETTTRIDANRWSWNPDGFYTRYKTNGYSTTRIEVFVPPSANDNTTAGPFLHTTERSPVAGHRMLARFPHVVVYDPSKDLILPGDGLRQRLAVSAVPAQVPQTTPEWRHVVEEGDRGGHRCTETYGVFAHPTGLMPPQRCDVEVCTPYSNHDGKISEQWANYAMNSAAQEAGNVVTERLNANLPMEICQTWKELFREMLDSSVPGSTVSSIGTTK